MRAGAWSMAGPMLLLMACTAADGSSLGEKGTASTGASIFRSECVMCHGHDGKRKMSGAKDLAKSTLTEEEMNAIVTHGSGAMAGFGTTLSKKQIEEVVEHVRTLHEQVR